MAQGVVDSDEVKKRNLSDDAYIWALYKVFLNGKQMNLENWRPVSA